jgi:hypothetical protein
MAANCAELNRWASHFDLPCDEQGFLEALGSRWERARATIAAVLLAVFVIGGAASIVIEGSSALEGDGLTFEERANVMLASDVVASVLDDRWILPAEALVAPTTTLVSPAGTYVGAAGVEAFASQLSGSEENRPFEIAYSSVEGDRVVLNWRVAGPLSPGILAFQFLPEGSYLAGEAEVTLAKGIVREIVLTVTS